MRNGSEENYLNVDGTYAGRYEGFLSVWSAWDDYHSSPDLGIWLQYAIWTYFHGWLIFRVALVVDKPPPPPPPQPPFFSFLTLSLPLFLSTILYQYNGLLACDSSLLYAYDFILYMCLVCLILPFVLYISVQTSFFCKNLYFLDCLYDFHVIGLPPNKIMLCSFFTVARDCAQYYSQYSYQASHPSFCYKKASH